MPSYYKYRPLFVEQDGSLSEKTIESVIDPVCRGYYYLPNRKQLNDPIEGMFENQIYNSVAGLLQSVEAIGEAQDLKHSIIDYMNQIDHTNDNSGVFSLTADSIDELMWAHYANSHHGVAIEYDLEKLLRFSANHRTHSFPVRYADAPPAIEMPLAGQDPKAIVMAILGNKSVKWSHEQEHRIIIENVCGPVPHDYRAVKSITFGFRVHDSVREKVYELTNNQVLEYYEIDIPPDEYSLKRSLIASMPGSKPKGNECVVNWVDHLDNVAPQRRLEFAEIMKVVIEDDPHFKELMLADLVKTEDEYVLLMYEADHALEIEQPARYTRHRFPI